MVGWFLAIGFFTNKVLRRVRAADTTNFGNMLQGETSCAAPPADVIPEGNRSTVGATTGPEPIGWVNSCNLFVLRAESVGTSCATPPAEVIPEGNLSTVSAATGPDSSARMKGEPLSSNGILSLTCPPERSQFFLPLPPLPLPPPLLLPPFFFLAPGTLWFLVKCNPPQTSQP